MSEQKKKKDHTTSGLMKIGLAILAVGGTVAKILSDNKG